MRKIEKAMLSAWDSGREFSQSNTMLKFSPFGGLLIAYLHGNMIASKDLETGKVSYSCAGWHTVTTASRLRALGCNCGIRQGLITNLETGEIVPSILGR